MWCRSELALERVAMEKVRAATEVAQREQQETLHAWELKQQRELERQAKQQQNLMRRQVVQIQQLVAAADKETPDTTHRPQQPPQQVGSMKSSRIRTVRPHSARTAPNQRAVQHPRPMSASATGRRDAQRRPNSPVKSDGELELRGWDDYALAASSPPQSEFDRQRMRAAELDLAIKSARKLEHDIKAQEAERRLHQRLADAHRMRADAKKRAASRPPMAPVPRRPPHLHRVRKRDRHRKGAHVGLPSKGKSSPQTAQTVRKQSSPSTGAAPTRCDFSDRCLSPPSTQSFRPQAPKQSAKVVPEPEIRNGVVSTPWQLPVYARAGKLNPVGKINTQRSQFIMRTQRRARDMQARLNMMPAVRT
eukprot:SAG31_NODE_3324_length_4411_cov_1.686456_4_plen_363_part_00